MKCKGIGTSPGVALGRLRLYHPQETAVSRGLIAPEETEGEIASFLAARSEAITRADWALERLEGASRDIMLAQRDMLSDEAIRDAVTEQIRSELICGLDWRCKRRWKNTVPGCFAPRTSGCGSAPQI